MIVELMLFGKSLVTLSWVKAVADDEPGHHVRLSDNTEVADPEDDSVPFGFSR